MNEYNRWISYLYEYVGDHKEQNSGFLRVEVRGPQCRMRVGFGGNPGDMHQDGEVMLLLAGDNGVREIPLGILRACRSGREGSFVTRSENMAGSGLSWKAFSGLKIRFEESGREYRTYWDDRIDDMERRMKMEEKKVREVDKVTDEIMQVEKKEEKAEYDQIANIESDIESEQREKSDDTYKTQMEQTEEKCILEEDGTDEGQEEEYDDKENISMNSIEEKTLSERQSEEFWGDSEMDKKSGMEKKNEGMTYDEPREVRSMPLAETWHAEPRITWEQLRNTYPKVLPFGAADTWEVLRISLHDIGRLPREYWVLGANEFVIHGYYDYRHLVLIRDKAGEFCFLGVPGEAMEQDRRVAELFGFRQYRPADKGGYWLTGIKL